MPPRRGTDRGSLNTIDQGITLSRTPQSQRPRVAVLDYGIGNIRSAAKALEHLGADAFLATGSQEARSADGVVLPGVGAFGRCMEELRAQGLDQAVHDAIEDNKPFLGICVGMQMLFDASEESPGVEGLGVVPGTVRRLTGEVKVPHMGWNTVAPSAESKLFAELGESPWCYFVHSFAGFPSDPTVRTSICEYGTQFVAALEIENVWAVQFHPEKSGASGLAVLGNFLSACSSS